MSRLGLSLLAVSITSLTSLSSVALASGFAAPPPGAAPRQWVPPIDSERGDVPLAEVDAMPTRADVRAALVKMRAQNLAAFRAYYNGGIYPSNVVSQTTLNVWRDEADHFCAAATIMVKSGNADLAIRIAEDNNFIKLGDVKQGPVMDWITMSGFTQAELALIQRPFRPVARPDAPNRQPATDSIAPVITVNTVAPVDPRLRKAETARLLALYKKIDKQLVAKQKQSVDRAVDVLMKNPTLASELVASVRRTAAS